jgi:hypothetical protein
MVESRHSAMALTATRRNEDRLHSLEAGFQDHFANRLMPMTSSEPHLPGEHHRVLALPYAHLAPHLDVERSKAL